MPALLYGVPVFNFQIDWFLVAEQMSKGNRLYTAVWDDISPFAASVYWLIHLLFGKSILVHQIIAGVLIFVQGIILNQVLQERRVYLELTQIPVLLYLVLMTTFLDFFSLTPALMANTFLLLVIRYMFLHISEKRKYNAVFEIGAYIGIATLFYFPSFLILLVPLISFLIFTGTPINDYFLMLFAFVFTIVIAVLGFYMVGNEYEFYLNYIQSHFYYASFYYISPANIALLFAIPLIFVVFNFLKSPQYKRYTNYQAKCQNMMILWLLIALVSVFLDSKIAAYNVSLAIPAMVFLLTHYFLMMRNTFLKEIIFLLLLINVLYFNYSSLYQNPLILRVPFTSWQPYTLTIDTADLISKPHKEAEILQNKKILVLGENRNAYLNAQLATPYLNWHLAQRHFGNMNQYNILISIYKNFKDDMPDVLVDEKGNIQKMFKAIPLLANEYRKLPASNLYIRK